MCGVPGLRPLLCQVLFKPTPLPALKLRGAGRRQGAGPESGLALMQWLSSPVEGTERCSIQVLQLLAELLQVGDDDDGDHNEDDDEDTSPCVSSSSRSHWLQTTLLKT